MRWCLAVWVTTWSKSLGCVKTEPFKLKRQQTSGSNRAPLLWTLFGLMVLGLPLIAHAKPTLIWLLRDLPPMTILEGPKKGQGVIDQLMPLLIAGMPQYEHTLMRVNRARGWQMLEENSLACDPALLWSKARAQSVTYSIPAIRAVSNGLVVRQQDRGVLAPYLVAGEVDLAALLTDGAKQLGVVAERSYGEFIDNILQQAPKGSLTPHYGNDALSNLLSMQRLGRLQVVLGYWPEIRYQARHAQIDEEELQFYPIRGSEKYLSGYIACSGTEQGRQAIGEINQLLRSLPREHFNELYAQWLDPARRVGYLADARAFFELQAAH
ncbi:TIGR02285 family protein [Pseudomonas sp. Sample_9]|uniref:TIGR02285 family protein n=1 Tax=Pseudomonas sp. Sample_9 TaxID=2382158 RepID=UPI001032A818|nr:TIGR02285 family protein [Pseudomonas sp. Sample_9]